MRFLALTLCLSLSSLTGCDPGADTPEAPEISDFAVDPSMQNNRRQPPVESGDQTPPNGRSGGDNELPPSGTQGQDEDGTSTPDPAPTDVGSSCAETYEAVSACYDAYYACASACPDEACAKACEGPYQACYDAEVAKSSPQGAAAFNALRACEETHWQGCYDEGGVVYQDCAKSCADDACAQACGDQATEVLQSCLLSSCHTEYVGCGLADDSGQPNPSAGSDDVGASNGSDLTCGELYTCEDSCAGDYDCGKACYESGTTNAKSDWNALITCGQQHCNGQVPDAATYKSCLAQMCSSQYQTCFAHAGSGNPNGGTPAGGAGGTCGQGYDCILTCYSTSPSEEAFYSCMDGCNAAMSQNGKGLMDALAACTNAQCADVPGSFENYLTCQKDLCPSEYAACMNDG